MLYLVTMNVDIPPDTDTGTMDRLKREERAVAQRLQRAGEWRHLWRVAGRYANVSVFDVDSHTRLHEILSELPLFRYLDIQVTPLTAHPSALES